MAKVLQETKQPPKEKKANVFTRTGLDENLALKSHELQDMIKIRVQQEAIPANIKKGIGSADKMFNEFLRVNKVAEQYDYGQGYYFSEPPESRGHDLLKLGKDPTKRKEDYVVEDKRKTAEQIEQEQLTQVNTILNQTRQSS